jgi:hypothetical protein
VARALTIKGVGQVRALSQFVYPSLALAPFAEVPPWFIYDGSYRYFISTDHTDECQTPDNLFSEVVDCDTGHIALVSEAEADIFADPAQIPSGTAYKRDYEGVYSAQLVTSRAGKRYLVGIDHAENKNEVRTKLIGGRQTQVYYHNTVQPHDTTCWSGPVGNVYRDCNQDYNGFIDSSYAPDGASTSGGLYGWHDRGPIVWPRNGYVRSDGSKASWGVRHPSSIVEGRYLYAFYLDTGSTRSDPTGLATQGVGAGIVVARSPASDVAKPGAFEVWTRRGRWLPSLPHGLTPGDEARYFDRAGGASAPLLGSNSGSYYFAVARIEHPTRWRYLAVEHYSTAHSPSCVNRGTTLGDALWESNDLIHWQHPTPIPQLTSCGTDQPTAYDDSRLRFPHFLDSTGTSENAIDPASFYLIGTSADGITLVHLSIAP